MDQEKELINSAENLIELHKYDEAAQVLFKVLNEVNPKSLEALNDLCVLRILEKNYENALQIINNILELDPANETALNNFQFIKQELDELDKQVENVDKNVSIIIPIFNKKELTLSCLRSLNGIDTNVNFEVIIVDNASTDGSKEELENLKDGLRYNLIYIHNEINYGFAKGNNIGSKSASFNNILFLNNDTIAKEDFLSSSLKILNSNNVGIVGIKLLYPDSSIQHGGIAFNDKKRPEHIYKFYAGNYPLADYILPLQAVTGACLFIKKSLFEKLNGFEESYINGWEDIDLCFRVRKIGLAVYYNGQAKIYHFESQSDNRLKFATQNSELFYSKWKDSIICDLNSFYSINTFNSINSFSSKYRLPKYLNMAIKIGVPTRKDKNWGDVYYANSLAEEIKKLGHRAVIHYLNEWNQEDKNIDVVIHIKGLSKYELKEHNFNVIWVINHPELHTLDELNAYDLILVASQKYYQEIKSKINKPIYYLPQATDPKVFNNDQPEQKDIDLLFVGNNYEFKNNSCRKIIKDILSLGQEYNLQIIGEHWEEYIDEKYIKGKFIDWSDLPSLYKRAKIVLNDHQKTMRENGFINNRTYDIALTQSFQLSDSVDGLDEIGIVNYKNLEELKIHLDFYLADAKAREVKAEENYSNCIGYTFNERTLFIIQKIFETANSYSQYENCNICGHKGNNFLDMGSRKGVRCPVCHSLERQRSLWFLLLSRNYLKPGMKVLEIAPLSKKIFGDYIKSIGCEYVCIDKWKTGNPLDHRDTSWIDFEMDICDLKFDDNTFDVVLMQHVIEEVPDDVKAFSEISRVLNLTGVAILEIPHFVHKRKTYEYYEARKFGNVREYGVDFYEKLIPYFKQRYEERIDTTTFSLLYKDKKEEHSFSLPVLMDHPRINSAEFKSRFYKSLRTLNNSGYHTLTTAQVENYYNGNVSYKNAAWITLDDGKKDDITEALPLLAETNNYATSFIIPNHLSGDDWQLWNSIRDNKFLDIQSHSYSHKQHFINDTLIGINKDESKFQNLLNDMSLYGFPIFEFNSSLKGKQFIPSKEVIEFCIEFYRENHELSDEEYLLKLKDKLNENFSNLGRYETEEEQKERCLYEIVKSKDEITSKISKDVYALSFPWGENDEVSANIAKEHYSLVALVNPQKINKKDDPYSITRINIPGTANIEFQNALFWNRPWEELQYKSYSSVCVLMTTYNRYDTIADSIQSVVSQTYKDWTLIIVNDGGEDISELINLFDDPRIKYYNLSHRGKPACLNYAIENSKSKYIAYLDDDDKYFPNHLEVLVTYLENHLDKEFVYSYSEEVKKFFYENKWVEISRQPRYFYQASSKHFRMMNHIPNLCAVHKRSLFEKTGLYDEQLEVLIDWDMYRRLALASEPVFINICTAEYLRKVSRENTLEEQMTGMFYTNPVKYYKNRLRILAKNFPSDTHNPKVVVYYLTEKNFNDFRFFIYKVAHFRKTQQFDIAVLVDTEISEALVELIKVAESRNALAIWNQKRLSKGQFIDDFIRSNKWTNFILLDRSEQFNNVNFEAIVHNKEKVICLSDSLASKYQNISAIIKKNRTDEITVSIIIPTFNNWSYTDKCLNSILTNKSNKTTYEVIVVDNGSSDETTKKLTMLLKKEPKLKVVLNNENLGYAKANNIGATHAAGKYLLFLNNDTSIKNNYLDEMLECLTKNSAGIVGAKLLYKDNIIQHAGVVINDNPDPIFPFHIFKGKQKDYMPANMVRQYQAVTGACMLIQKEFFNELNGFNEDYINGYEDIDLCFKANKAGKKTFYCPQAEVYHYESKTPGRFNNVQHNVQLLLSKWKNEIKKDEVEALSTPKVSIVIPVFNQLNYTKKCIESLITYTHIPYEIIVVDNASTDDTQKYLSSLEHVKIISNKINKGYPAAINQGLRSAVGEYVVLLNNDILATPNWLEGLIEVAESEDKIGLVGPAINIVSGLQLDQEAKYKDANSAIEYSRKIRTNRRFAWMECPRVAFVCTLIKRKILNTIGGLDERFTPGNYEDDDYCLRTLLAGYKIVIAWDTFIHHYGSKSFTANGVEAYDQRLETNKKIFVDKWGYTPEEIMILNKKPKEVNINIPLNTSEFIISFDHARIHINDKNYQEALEALDKAIETYEEGAGNIRLEEILNIAGNVSLAANNIQAARQYFETELEINGNSATACSGLGQVFAIEENYENAKTMLEWAVKNDQSNQLAKDRLSEVNQLLGFAEDHNTLFEDVDDSANTEEIIQKIVDCFVNDKFSEAINIIESNEKIITQYLENLSANDYAEFYNMKGFMYLSSDKDIARTCFENALNANPTSSQACVGLGEVFFIDNMIPEAKTMYEWGAVYDSQNQVAIDGLARLNELLGYDLMHNTLLENIDFDDIFNKAAGLYKESKFQEAIDLIEQNENGLSLLINNGITGVEFSTLLNLKGFCYLGLNDEENAELAFGKSINTNPESSQACAGIGVVFLSQGRTQDAKTMLEWALKNDSSNAIAKASLAKANEILGYPENHNSLFDGISFETVFVQAYNYFINSDFSSIIKLFDQHEEELAKSIYNGTSKEDYAALLNLKGYAYLSLEEIDNARKSFEHALKTNPESSQACTGLGEVFLYNNQIEEAKTMFEWGVKNAPQNKFAIDALANVNKLLGLNEYHSSLTEV